MALVETEGIIYHIGETENKGKKKDFFKREFILEEKSNDTYGGAATNFIKFVLTGIDTGRINDMSVGDKVRVRATVSGRKWKSPEGKEVFFLELRAVDLGFGDIDVREEPKEKVIDDLPF